MASEEHPSGCLRRPHKDHWNLVRIKKSCELCEREDGIPWLYEVSPLTNTRVSTVSFAVWTENALDA